MSGCMWRDSDGSTAMCHVSVCRAHGSRRQPLRNSRKEQPCMSLAGEGCEVGVSFWPSPEQVCAILSAGGYSVSTIHPSFVGLGEL